MRRHWQYSSGQLSSTRTTLRLGSMIAMLLILGMIYSRAREPQTWRWLAPDPAPEVERTYAVNAAAPEAEKTPRDEQVAPASNDTLVEGPTDEDPDEWTGALNQFAALTDKAPLEVSEMPAYWRLMRWARAQSFADLEQRAQRDPVFTRFWEQPDAQRGKPFRLRLHIKRIVKWDKVAQNSAGVKDVYEAWGWTDESKSYPYLVVFSDLPEGMEVGPDVQEEGVFVGYFLKTMAYKAFDKGLSTPLLIGRMHAVKRPGRRSAARAGGDEWWWIGGAGLAALAVFVLFRTRAAQRTRPAALARRGEATVEEWLQQAEPPAEPATVQPAASDAPRGTADERAP